MKDNPYSKMIEIMQKQGSTSNPPSIQIGEVISPSPNLVIRVNDLQIDKANLLIADYLLSDYERKVVIQGEEIIFSKSGPRPFGATDGAIPTTDLGAPEPHYHEVTLLNIDKVPVTIKATNSNSYIKTTDTLKRGDLLAILPVENRQLYIILARLMEVS